MMLHKPGSWRTLMLLFLAAALALVVTGCWSRREINQLSFVMALGIDKGRRPNTYLVSYQIPIPGAMAGGGSGAGMPSGGASQAQGRKVWTPATEGASLLDAIRRLTEFDPRRGYFAHAGLIVIGEEQARQGIFGIVDFLDRNLEIRRTTLVYVAKGTAQKVIEATPALEPIPAVVIRGLVRWGPEAAVSSPVSIQEMLYTLSSGKRDLALPFIFPTTGTVKSSGKDEGDGGSQGSSESGGEQRGDELRPDGYAVFKEGRMVGTLNRLETRGYLWTLGKVKEGIFLVKAPGLAEPVSLEVRQAKTRVSPLVQGNDLRFLIQVQVNYDVAEITGPLDISREVVRHSLSRRLAATIRNEIDAALLRAQKEYQTDIFGFQEMLYQRQPKIWESVKGRWNEVFPNMPVEIEVETMFRDSGRVSRPLRSLVKHPLSQRR